MAQGQGELIAPPPRLGDLRHLSTPAVVALLLTIAIGTLDVAANPDVIFIGPLAIPPIIAATSGSRVEAALVGAICLLFALASFAWEAHGSAGQHSIALATVAGGAVTAIWLARLQRDLDRQSTASELLADAGSLMGDALNQGDRAQHLADLAVPALADVALVDLVMPDRSIRRLGARSGGSPVADIFVRLRSTTPIDPSGPHPVAQVIRTGETINLDELSDAQIDEITTRANERSLLRKHRFRSCIVLPLRAHGRVLGALTLWIMAPSKAFDKTARDTAQRLADRSALALDNARLHEEQAHIASVLQRSLLPRSLPEIQGFESSSRFLAAGEAYEVGGDFYDVFRVGSGTWAVVIGDVCGKGPEAASLTALARYTVRMAATPGRLPSDVLRMLHDSIAQDRSDMRFCTAALAQINAAANGSGSARVTLSLGGHPLPLVIRRDGRVEPIGESGTLLGAVPSPTLSDVEADLEEGDSLVLYTDGVLDASDSADRDRLDWLQDHLAAAAGKSADEVAEHLARAAVARHGGEPRDDIAVVVLRRRDDE